MPTLREHRQRALRLLRHLSIPAKRGSGVSQRGRKKKDRHDGRSYNINNVEKRRTGTEAEDVGVGSRSCILILFLFHCHITGFQFTFGIYRICLQYFQFPVI